MVDPDRHGTAGPAADPCAAHQHAEHLQRRIRALAEEIASSEDVVADVLEDSARLRPHAAPRLERAAREARAYAERERRFARSPIPEVSPTPPP